MILPDRAQLAQLFLCIRWVLRRRRSGFMFKQQLHTKTCHQCKFVWTLRSNTRCTSFSRGTPLLIPERLGRHAERAPPQHHSRSLFQHSSLLPRSCIAFAESTGPVANYLSKLALAAEPVSSLQRSPSNSEALAPLSSEETPSLSDSEALEKCGKLGHRRCALPSVCWTTNSCRTARCSDMS